MSSDNGYVTINSNNQYVDVESVRFTGADIGVSGTPKVITVKSTGASVIGQLDVGTAGARNFVVTSAGDTTITGTLGVTGATQLTTAKVSSTLEVTGVTTLKEDVSMTKTTAEIKHTGGTGLQITSAGFVEVESLRFSGLQVGVGSSTIITLATTGASITGTLLVSQTATLQGSATISGSLGVTGATSLSTAQLSGGLSVSGSSSLAAATLTGALNVGSTQLLPSGNSVVGGTMRVNGAATFNSDLTVVGTFTALGNHRIGDLTPADTLTVNATSNFEGAITLKSTLDVLGTTKLRSTLDVTGATTMSDLTIGASKFTVLGASGDTVVGGSLTSKGTFIVDNLGVSTFKVDATTGNTLVTGTATVSGVSTFSEDVIMNKNVAVLRHTGNSGLSILSTTMHVDVESVRFTGADIGVSGTPKVITVTSTGASVTGKLEVGTAGASNFVVTKDGDTTITGTLGVTGATQLTTAAVSNTLGVTNRVTLGDDIYMTKSSAEIKHTVGTSLTITSAGYVEVESVKFTGAAIGIGTTANVIALATSGASVTGTLQTSGLATLHSATVTNALQVNGLSTLASATVTGATTMATATVSSTLDVTNRLTLGDDIYMTKSSAEIKHTVGTSLTITSAGYVEVENVKFTGTATGATMGIGATTDVIALATTGASVTGKLDVGTTGARNFVVTKDGDTAITGTLGVTGATTLAGVQTGAATLASAIVSGSLQSGAATLASASVNGLTSMATATVSSTLEVTGVTTLKEDVSMTKAAAAISHTGTSLTITSAGFVEVESVRITHDSANSKSVVGFGATDVFHLSATDVSMLGTLSSTGNFDVGAPGGRKFSVAAGSGDTTTSGDIILAKSSVAMKHTAAGASSSITMSSDNGYVTINSNNQYVDVESVRFTGADIGVSGTPKVITVKSTGASLIGQLDVGTAGGAQLRCDERRRHDDHRHARSDRRDAAYDGEGVEHARSHGRDHTQRGRYLDEDHRRNLTHGGYWAADHERGLRIR